MTKNRQRSKHKTKEVKIEIIPQKSKKSTIAEKIEQDIIALKARYNEYKNLVDSQRKKDLNYIILSYHECSISVLNELGAESLSQYLEPERKKQLINALLSTTKAMMRLEEDSKARYKMSLKIEQFEAELNKLNKPHDKLNTNEVTKIKTSANEVSEYFITVLKNNEQKATEQISNNIVNNTIKSIEDKGYKISEDQKHLIKDSLIPRVIQALQNNNTKEIKNPNAIADNLSSQIINENPTIFKFFGRLSIKESTIRNINVKDNIFTDHQNTPPQTPKRKSLVRSAITKENRDKAKEIITRNKNKIKPPVSKRKSFSANKDNPTEKAKPTPPKRKHKEDHGI